MCKGALLGSREVVYRGLEQQALETGISLHRGRVENHGGSVHRKLEGGLWKWSISLQRGSAGEPGRELWK
jgi:hypothetical protein